MRLRILLLSVLLSAPAWAGIVDNVRLALAQNNFSAAESALNSYRSQQGVTAEYLEAYSWMGRAALEQGEYDRAAAYAKQTKAMVLEQLKQRSLDADEHLPIALGAAFEVQSQVLAGAGAADAGGRTPAGRAADVRKYFHSRPPAKKSESACVAGKTCACAEGRGIVRSETARGGATQRIARASVFLGALVCRLQG